MICYYPSPSCFFRKIFHFFCWTFRVGYWILSIWLLCWILDILPPGGIPLCGTGYWILSIWLLCWILDIPCWILDIENRLLCWILDIPCWILDIENRLLCWILDIPCWILDILPPDGIPLGGMGYWILSLVAAMQRCALCVLW